MIVPQTQLITCSMKGTFSSYLQIETKNIPWHLSRSMYFCNRNTMCDPIISIGHLRQTRKSTASYVRKMPIWTVHVVCKTKLLMSLALCPCILFFEEVGYTKLICIMVGRYVRLSQLLVSIRMLITCIYMYDRRSKIFSGLLWFGELDMYVYMYNHFLF